MDLKPTRPPAHNSLSPNKLRYLRSLISGIFWYGKSELIRDLNHLPESATKSEQPKRASEFGRIIH